MKKLEKSKNSNQVPTVKAHEIKIPIYVELNVSQHDWVDPFWFCERGRERDPVPDIDTRGWRRLAEAWKTEDGVWIRMNRGSQMFGGIEFEYGKNGHMESVLAILSFSISSTQSYVYQIGRKLINEIVVFFFIFFKFL